VAQAAISRSISCRVQATGASIGTRTRRTRRMSDTGSWRPSSTADRQSARIICRFDRAVFGRTVLP